MNTGAGPGAHRSRAPVCIPHATRACGASVCLSDVPTSRHQCRTRQSQDPDGAGRLATSRQESTVFFAALIPIVNGEMLFGNDRLEFIRERLEVA